MPKKISAVCEEIKHQQGNSIVVFAVGAKTAKNDIGLPGAIGQRLANTTVTIQSVEPEVIKALRVYVPGEKYEITIP